MQTVLLIGAGGSTRVILDILKQERPDVHVLGILDDDPAKQGSSLDGVPILGPLGALAELKEKASLIAQCIGAVRDCKTRDRVYCQLKEFGLPFLSVQAQSACVASTARLGEAVMLMQQASIGPQTSIADHAFINTGAIIEHDCSIGRSSFVGPGAKLAGYCKIGERVFIGIGAVLSGGVSVGDDAIIGAGAVVVRDVPARTICYGNPAHHQSRPI